MPDVVIAQPQVASTPAVYTIAGAQAFELLSVQASFDGSGAAAAFLPALQLLDPGGHVIATATASSVAAGGSAAVSWFPGVGIGQGAATGGGALVKLFDSLLTGSAAAFSFTPIPQTFNHLWIMASLRGDTAGNSSGIVRFNGDSGAVYEFVDSTGTHTAGLTGIPALRALDPNADTGHFGVTDVLCHDYVENRKDHTLHGTYGVIPVTATPAGFQAVTVGGQYCAAAAAPLTSMTVTPSAGGNFVTGSRLTVYGLL